MAFQAVPNTVQVTLEHAGSGDLLGASANWSFYFTTPAAPTLANITAVVDSLVSDFGTNYQPRLVDEWTLTKIRGRSLHVEGGPSYERVNIGSGTRSGEPVPPSVCVVWRFSGSSGGASSRGRVYLPIGSEADISGNEWAQSFIDAIETNEQAWVQNAIATVVGASHTVVSRFLGTEPVERRKPVPRAAGVTTTVANYSPQTMVGSQRERRPS